MPQVREQDCALKGNGISEQAEYFVIVVPSFQHVLVSKYLFRTLWTLAIHCSTL